jgi:S1/P1 Nuclease
MALTAIARGALAGLCSLSLAPIPALAWGPQGHETIATVARDMLAARNPKAANEIFAIIKANDLPTEFPVRPSAATPHPKPATCRMRTIASVANWPDCVRKTFRYSSTAKFHFDDVPLCPSSMTLPPKAGYCANGRCGSSALGDYIAILKDRTAAPGKRAEALMAEDGDDLGRPKKTRFWPISTRPAQA